MSRSVAREALKMLAAKGILGARPRQRNFILPTGSWNLFDPDGLRWLANSNQPIALLRQLHELRTALEPHAAQCARPAQVSEIQTALKPMLEHEHHRIDEIEIRIAVHLAVLKASNNPFFIRYSKAITPALRIPLYRNRPSPRWDGDIPDYVAVLVAITSRTAGEAHRAMQALLDRELALFKPAADATKPAGLWCGSHDDDTSHSL